MKRDMHILQAFCSFSVIVWAFFSITRAHAKDSQQIPLNVVKLWASAFGGEIKSISAKYSGSQFLQKKYKEHEKTVTVKEIDGLQLVKKLAKDMEQMFHNKAEAVRRLVEAAENAHLQHEYNSDLEYEYFNAVLINEKDENGNYVELGKEFILEPNEHFNNLPVNISLSDVQIPTNKYNKDPAIVNGVSWSEALNKVFVDNFERDPSLIWQYFGSANGFFRQYPGIKWEPDENGVIAFDCRNRKWYIQAATSPKDVIILVDVSGSMKGLRMTIAKQTVSSILDTLGDDDFFNIIAYNEELHYVEPCLNNTLVQADRNNKEHFREHLDTLNAKGIGMLGFALTEAFILLNQFNNTGHGSSCSQAIMLVTDGAVDTYDSVFAKYNWPDRKVRIFAYLIGREAVFSENLKWMACANKGYFTQISTLADVQENVMEYLHVLSRPKVIDQEHDIVWTEAYIDSTLPQAKQYCSSIKQNWPMQEDRSFPEPTSSLTTDSDRVLMTTIAMPVFSKKNETRTQGILLGVVGTDVPVKELLKVIPKYKLGVHGYAFAITNNGYVLTHPDLRPPYEEGKRRIKPSYKSVDLSELEWEDKDNILRNGMVNRKTGKFSMEVKKTVEKGNRVLVMTNDYYYTDIKGTPFSLGVALSRGHGKYYFQGNVTVEEGLHDLDHPDLSLMEDWNYCNIDIHPQYRNLFQLEAVKLFLTGKEPLLQCDKELIQEVLFDAVVTAPLEAYWTSLALNRSENADKGVEVSFLGTRTGLSRVNLFVGPEQRTDKDFLSPQDKENIFTADHFPLWYRKSAEQLPGTFVYSIPFSTETENKSNVVTASTTVQLLDNRKSPVVAAVGIQMKLEFFQRKFWTASRQCASLDGKCSISCDDEIINCYLIDNNGFILVSESYAENKKTWKNIVGTSSVYSPNCFKMPNPADMPPLTGTFFGEVEGAVMNKLLMMGSFKRVTLYDYQAMCRTTVDNSDSAHSLLDPYYVFFAAVKWIMTELILFLVEFNLCSWWNSDFTVKAQRAKQVLQPCDTEYAAFVSERTIKETTGTISCDGCHKSFVIQQIPSSNLFMVVVDASCECSVGPITMDPIEIIYNESMKCEHLRSQKIRRRPDSCHPFHAEENARECGGVLGLRSCRAILLLPLILTLSQR